MTFLSPNHIIRNMSSTLSPEQRAARWGTAAKAAVDARPNHDDDCYGVGEALALHYARETAEKALVDPEGEE